MQKKHIITISGRPGSGKSTASKAVAAHLGYKHFSSGDLFRAMAGERGIDVNQANLIAEKEKEIDFLVDQRLRDIGENEDERVIDSRLAWYWMPQSFKVYLDLDLEVAAERILKNIDSMRLANEHLPDDPAEYAELLGQRLASETRRYEALYGANPYDHNNYDLIVDTAANNPQQVIEKIQAGFTEWIKQ